MGHLMPSGELMLQLPIPPPLQPATTPIIGTICIMYSYTHHYICASALAHHCHICYNLKHQAQPLLYPNAPIWETLPCLITHLSTLQHIYDASSLIKDLSSTALLSGIITPITPYTQPMVVMFNLNIFGQDYSI